MCPQCKLADRLLPAWQSVAMIAIICLFCASKTLRPYARFADRYPFSMLTFLVELAGFSAGLGRRGDGVFEDSFESACPLGCWKIRDV